MSTIETRTDENGDAKVKNVAFPASLTIEKSGYVANDTIDKSELPDAKREIKEVPLGGNYVGDFALNGKYAFTDIVSFANDKITGMYFAKKAIEKAEKIPPEDGDNWNKLMAVEVNPGFSPYDIWTRSRQDFDFSKIDAFSDLTDYYSEETKITFPVGAKKIVSNGVDVIAWVVNGAAHEWHKLNTKTWAFEKMSINTFSLSGDPTNLCTANGRFFVVTNVNYVGQNAFWEISRKDWVSLDKCTITNKDSYAIDRIYSITHGFVKDELLVHAGTATGTVSQSVYLIKQPNYYNKTFDISKSGFLSYGAAAANFDTSGIFESRFSAGVVSYVGNEGKHEVAFFDRDLVVKKSIESPLQSAGIMRCMDRIDGYLVCSFGGGAVHYYRARDWSYAGKLSDELTCYGLLGPYFLSATKSRIRLYSKNMSLIRVINSASGGSTQAFTCWSEEHKRFVIYAFGYIFSHIESVFANTVAMINSERDCFG